MDLHINSGGEISVEDLVEKHKADLAIQHKYEVVFKSIWVNKEQGMVFCLMEGPDKDACTKVHQEAHGDKGCNLIEVSPGDYDKFLSGSSPNEHDIVETEKGKMDTGYRTVLHVEIIDPVYSSAVDFGKIEHLIHKYDGSLIPEHHKSIKGIFVHPVAAISCARKVKAFLNRVHEHLDFRIAIVSGRPVDQNHDKFYGYALDLSEKLSKTGARGRIRTNRLTRDLLYKQDKQAVPSDVDVLSRPDEDFLYQLIERIETNFSDPNFKSTDLARIVGVSRSQLFRKVRTITGYTPNTLIREIRLNESLKQLRHSDQIAQIAYDTGFNSPSYFTKIFKQRFNTLPSVYIESVA